MEYTYKLVSNVPVDGCFVTIDGRDSLGIVHGHKNVNGTASVKVMWGGRGEIKWHDVTELRNGLRADHVVQDIPRSNTRRTLGTGTVRAHHKIAGRELVLVQLHSNGETRWLPFERLRRLRDARMKFTRAEASGKDDGERFRLKALAYSLDSWNEVTGALDRFDVDPLPHQIDLVHRIMTSEQSNWLIADDVGLGKTIEVGLLLAAMKHRRQARRVLIICPAGIVRQWQDEMSDKFNETFKIYGSDFNINQASHWSGYDKVIVSIDRAKTDSHKAIFGESGEWDVIVFDEAHHLSKIEHQAATQRYQLAELLRERTDAFIFLTGTPHSGRTDHFINILGLLRPDLIHRLANVFTNPSVISEVILRNRKSLVTDANGKFIFKGQKTSLVEVPLSKSAIHFSNELHEYLRNGYVASETGGASGRAIGFVMTTYRKLASSSIAAIERALYLRLDRLRGNQNGSGQSRVDYEEMSDAFREGIDGRDDLGDYAESISNNTTRGNPFFIGEQAKIGELLTVAKQVRQLDLKLNTFLSEIVYPVEKQGEKLLIFTEYRATQDYLIDTLKRLYPQHGISQINGSMSLDEKRDNIREFNKDHRFMITTEAGGEGINLHEQCHILVNYDLPWNPVRLVQRLGRLYRYGQMQPVIVFNLMADDGFDNRALNMMLKRVSNIARDLAEVSTEFQAGLEDEVVGELLERVDIASLLTNNKTMDLDRTEEEIIEAISRAQKAKNQQERLFSHVEGYDPQATTVMHMFGPEDVLRFLEGIFPYKEVEIRNRLYDGRVLELVLPDEMRGRFSEFPERATVVRITADRKLARDLPKIAQMDFKSPFFTSLIDFAKSPEFKGEYANIIGPESGYLALYKLRWQTDQGIPREEALLPVFLPKNGKQAETNPRFFAHLISQPMNSCKPVSSVNTTKRAKALALLDKQADKHLASRSTTLRHPNQLVLLATADLTPHT